MGVDATVRRMPDVLAIGNAIVDVLAHADDEFLDRHGLAKGSMTLVDGARAEALYADMGPGVEISGGSAANTAAGIAALGATAAFIGKVRDDQLGAVYRHDLRAIGVAFDVPAAPADDPDPTARSLILVTPDAQRTMNTNLGIAGRLQEDDVDAELVESSSIVFAEGYLWDSEVAYGAIEKAFAIARSAGRKVSLTLSDTFCVERHPDTFARSIRLGVDVLFANEAEAHVLTGRDDFEAAVAEIAGMVPLAFVTRSGKGAVVVRGEERHDVPAHRVDALVDTTGAGDLFAAGALYGLVRGADLVTCTRLGCLAAAEVISHVGARPQADLRALADADGLP
jgi:sugar/nucleoside kinase (ribokinase family)